MVYDVDVFRVRSPVVGSMFVYLLRVGEAFARDIASVVGVESRFVYSYLKPWFGRFVEVSRAGCFNVYRATRRLVEASKVIMSVVEGGLGRVRGKVTRSKVEREAIKVFRERFGRDMDADHRLVLSLFIDVALSGRSPYIQVEPSRGETLTSVVKTMVRQRYGVELADDRVVEILKDFMLSNIIYVDRRFYKARLDKSLLMRR